MIERLQHRLRRRRAFLAVFESTDGEIALRHLGRYCRAQSSTFVQGEPDTTAYLQGRRDVFLEIMAQLHMSEGQLRRMMEREETHG
jgi:hypothetical protein